jgi:hypothetical protein
VMNTDDKSQTSNKSKRKNDGSCRMVSVFDQKTSSIPIEIINDSERV